MKTTAKTITYNPAVTTKAVKELELKNVTAATIKPVMNNDMTALSIMPYSCSFQLQLSLLRLSLSARTQTHARTERLSLAPTASQASSGTHCVAAGDGAPIQAKAYSALITSLRLSEP
jgi:hypothetical protein